MLYLAYMQNLLRQDKRENVTCQFKLMLEKTEFLSR